MRTPAGVLSPVNGDIVVYHQSLRTSLRPDPGFVVRRHPHSADGEAYDSYDEGVHAATRLAAAAGVNVFSGSRQARR